MKIKKEILSIFLAVMFIILPCGGGLADTDVGSNYSLGGFISLGGGWLSDQPRHMDRGYLKKYVPFPQGFLADTDLKLESKEGLDYYIFRMHNPGLSGDQDYLLQAGKIGVYHAQIEYDQLQNLYCTVNPFNRNIGIGVQRLRFSGYFSPTLEFTIFAEDQFLRRTGTQPSSINTGPGNPYNLTTFLRTINYKQNDMRAGLEYGQPTDQKSIFQGRVSYHLSTFENGQADQLGRTPPVGAVTFPSLPPSNMASYVTAEGALNLKSYWNTRVTGSLSYGWLSQNDFVTEATTAAASPTAFATVAGRSAGFSGLGATTFAADIGGVSRPIDPLTLRASYRAYNFQNDQLPGKYFGRLSPGVFNPTFATSALLPVEWYDYFRQGVNLGADYRVNNMLAFDVGYNWQGVDRTNAQGNTSSHTPRVGLRLSPTSWLSLMTNYALTSRTGTKFMVSENEGEPGVPLTYKFYTGSLLRNNFNFIAEVYPANTVTTSFNFSIFNDNFTDSTFGIQSDKGWSAGADVSWRPHDRVALSLGYDHQQLQTKVLAVANLTPLGEAALISGDAGPTLTTSDSYDTFVARADIKLIPKKLDLTTRGSYSWSNSNFNNDQFMPNLNEYYADISTYLTYQFNEHWACRGGYIFEAFGLSKAYQTLYVQGITAAGVNSANQQFNTLGGYYRTGTAHILQAFLQYRF